MYLKWPCDSVPLNLYTHISNAGNFANKFASWMSLTLKMNLSVCNTIAVSYLTRPDELLDSLTRDRSVDKIVAYQSVLRFLSTAGMSPCFFFLDQWEEAVSTVSPSKMGDFTSEMRRMIEAGSNLATIVVTLHPDSERKLNTKSSENLLAIAPKDPAHVIDVSTLSRRSKACILLANRYLENFRKGDPPTSSFPFDPQVIMYISYVKEGNIRYVLQQLHSCIEFALKQEREIIDLAFIRDHHVETMGTELNGKQYEAFLTDS